NFFDLLRTLKIILRNDFISIYYLQQSASVYDEEIISLEKISAAFEQQSSKGYIAPVEAVRIKAQLFSLRSELNDLRNQINDKESELRLVLAFPHNQYIIPQIDTFEMVNQNPQAYPLQSLIDSAYQNRTDLKIAKANQTLSQQNYSYQKALAFPDLFVGGTYDRRGSYIPNFNGVSAGLNIPIFNRNQGNIKASKNLINYNVLLVQNTEKTIEEQVYRALEKAIDADKLYQSMDKTFTGTFSQLAKSVFENYQKRNIGLLDFLNFYDSYKQYITQLNYILLNRTNALESINFLTGSFFFNK
ncbi:MAG TPA: TolC family protein, partial [Chitinophagaceae bacterium]|nr:TolC family protein [Chitinophagaceae bacterium]